MKQIDTLKEFFAKLNKESVQKRPELYIIVDNGPVSAKCMRAIIRTATLDLEKLYRGE